MPKLRGDRATDSARADGAVGVAHVVVRAASSRRASKQRACASSIICASSVSRHLVAAFERAVARAGRRDRPATSSGLRSRSSRCSAPRLTCSSRSVRPMTSFERAEAERGQDLAHLLGDEAEQVDDLLRRAGELLRAALVLRADADRAGVGMALPHHDAAHGDQRGRADAEFLGAEHRGDDDVAAGADAAVGAQRARGGAGG